MFKKLLLSVIIAAPVIAHADWIKIDKDEEYTYYIDPERSRITNESLQYAETWIKSVIHTDLTKDGLSVGDHSMTKFNIRCTNKELALVASYRYKNGRVLNNYTPSYPTYKAAIPDSRGEFFVELVCDIL